MGCGFGKTYKIVDESTVNSIKIDEEIRRTAIEEMKSLKILLLGSSDSGKSTIAKQMRILHKEGFNESEMLHFRSVVYKNLIQSYHYIARGILELTIPIPHWEKPLITKFLTNHNALTDTDCQEQIEILKHIRHYKCVERLLERRLEVYLPDNTNYFFSDLDRIFIHDYQPNIMDVLHARIITSGVYEIEFNFKKFNISLIDVGGQRTERRKWIHCFSNVTAILFITSLSSYDQFMVEDPTTNRMRDSLELFTQMFKSQFLQKSSFILFLNKKDLFENKLSYSPLEKYFPKYEGKNDFKSASLYIQQLFMSNQKEVKKERIFPHFTNATDTKNVEFMFAGACNMIIERNLSRSGMS